MKDLITRSYSAIKGRGLIDSNTEMRDFLEKMNEELTEAQNSYINDPFENCIEEVTDLMTVCIMSLYHHGFDPIKEFEKVVIKNEKRADELGRS